MNTPEYDRATGRNEPASWQMGSQAMATLKFWASSSLSQQVDVVACGLTTGDANNIGGWTACGPVTWKTNWYWSGGFNCDANETINDGVQRQGYNTLWVYWCPNGSGYPIPSTSASGCKLFAVYDAPQCPSTDYIKDNID